MASPTPTTFGYRDPVTGEARGPQPKQQLAHECPADVTFYGGQAGGGKSEMLVVEAVKTCLRYPGVEVALFRRKHTELERSLVQRFHRLVPRGMAKFNSSTNRATFGNGSVLWFCHCVHESSVYDYQSAEWAFLGIDEASHFTEFQIDYLSTRVRSARPDIRKRILLASNPGNVGHGWLKRRFVRPDLVETGGQYVRPYQVWRPLPHAGDPTPPSQVPTRCFIPATFADNYALVAADPTYLARIYQLGGQAARQLAEGDWDANDNMIVGAAWRASHRVAPTDAVLLAQGLEVGRVIPWHVLDDTAWRPPAGALLFGSVDYGYGAPWAFHLHASLADGHTRTFYERYQTRLRDREQAEAIAAVVRDRGYHLEWLVVEPVMGGSRAEMGLSKSIVEVYTEVLAPLGVRCRMGAGGRGARVSRPNRWLDALSVAPDGRPWWSVTTACPHLIRSVPEVPWDEDDPEVEDGESENHCYEGVGRFFEARPHAPRVQQVDPYAHLDPVSARYHRQRDQLERPPKQKLTSVSGFRGVA